MVKYRGWRVYDNVAYRMGTTIYGDSHNDVKRRIDAWMDGGLTN